MRRVCRSSSNTREKKVASELPDALCWQTRSRANVSSPSEIPADFWAKALHKPPLPGTVSEYPRPSSWDGGDHPNVQKNVSILFAPPALPSFPRPPSPRLSLPLGARNISKSELWKQTGIFCRRSLVSAAALPLHLPSKAEHLGQGGFLLTNVHFRSVSCPSRLRQSSIVFPGVWTGKLSSLGTRSGRAKPSHEVRRGTSLSEEVEGYLSEAITNFSPLFPNGTAPTGCAQRHMCVLTVCIGDPRPRPLRAVQVSSCTHEHCRAAPILWWS